VIVRTLASSAALAGAVLFASVAQADDKAAVTAFYTQILSGAQAPDLPDRINSFLSPDWQSIGGYQGPSKTREQFTRQMQGVSKTVPDLTWKIEETLRDGDRYIVRGRASGTPAGEFFGVAPTGKRFEIMSIDIHTVKDGKLVMTYHIEDWAGALGQLRAK
jgi:predicted ester cyclase